MISWITGLLLTAMTTTTSIAIPPQTDTTAISTTSPAIQFQADTSAISTTNLAIPLQVDTSVTPTINLETLAQPTTSVVADHSIETRAIWITKDDLYKGKDHMIDLYDQLSSAGFNTVCIPTLYRGMVTYPFSKYLTQDPEIKKQDNRDYLYWLINQAHKRGFMVEAWPEYGFYAYYTKDAALDRSKGTILNKNKDLMAIDADRGTFLHNTSWGDYYSLCPSNPKSQEIMIKLYTEMVNKYEFDALNLDRIRYPNINFCFCAYCKEHFRQDSGFELSKANLENNPDARKEFLVWRKQQVNHFMFKLRQELDKYRPDLLVTADVWPPNEIEDKGQDWPTWIQNGYIDIAIPMMYGENIQHDVEASLALVSTSHSIVAGIAAEGNSTPILSGQIELSRKRNLGGVTIWYSGKIAEHLDYIKTNLFKTPAKPYLPQRVSLQRADIKSSPEFVQLYAPQHPGYAGQGKPSSRLKHHQAKSHSGKKYSSSKATKSSKKSSLTKSKKGSSSKKSSSFKKSSSSKKASSSKKVSHKKSAKKKK